MISRNGFLTGGLLMGSLLFQTPASSQAGLDLFASGFKRPVAISNAGDSRLFVVEQAGIIRIADSAGSVREDPFLDISAKVKSSGNEQGLLGLAFHPDFASNGYFYVNYTDAGGNTVIARFSISGTDPGVADPESEFPVLSFGQPYSNHNGGDIKFGPDGYLYIGTGDGGSAGDPQGNGQDKSVLLGKILRIDVDGESPYAIPQSNPFAGESLAQNEIWALGLRNPWRFSFDRETGDLWIADVGQQETEEINFQPSGSAGGENYGWKCYEGSSVYTSQDCPGAAEYVFPVYEYDHDATGGCSVTGGFVYRGEKYPGLQGHYFFSDYCKNTLWSLYDSSGTWALSSHGELSDNAFSTFGEDRDGELYVAGLFSGSVYRIIDSGTALKTDLPGQSGFRAYPNPVRDMLWIETGESGQNPVHVTVYDLKGSVMYSSVHAGGPLRINLDFLEPGMYLLDAISGSSHAFHKFIKQ